METIRITREDGKYVEMKGRIVVCFVADAIMDTPLGKATKGIGTAALGEGSSLEIADLIAKGSVRLIGKMTEDSEEESVLQAALASFMKDELSDYDKNETLVVEKSLTPADGEQ